MSLEIIHGNRAGIEILALHGHLTFGQEDLDLRRELERLMKAATLRAAIDLSHLSRLDATGLGTLLFVLREMGEAGGKLTLFNLKPLHIELPVVTQIEERFDVFPTEQDGIDSFFPDRQVKPYDILEFVESLKLGQPKP
jgi:anti-sigma B factor antagonist